MLKFYFYCAKISFAVEIYRDGWPWKTTPTPLKSLIAFCCGAWWDKREGHYDFPSRDSALHFAFLTGDLDKLYFLQMLDYFRFENQLKRCRFLMDEPLGF